jgi:hypothetical protein
MDLSYILYDIDIAYGIVGLSKTSVLAQWTDVAYPPLKNVYTFNSVLGYLCFYCARVSLCFVGSKFFIGIQGLVS